MIGKLTLFRPSSTRHGFSLAEVMIAIAILGIGMIMVAASFPVGIDQARIVAHESVKPVIANEASSMIELYATGAEPPMVDDGVNPPKSFREIMEVAGGGLSDQLTANLDIHTWLNETMGQRRYPSTATMELERAPYNWSLLFKRNGSAIELVIFVQQAIPVVPRSVTMGNLTGSIGDQVELTNTEYEVTATTVPDGQPLNAPFNAGLIRTGDYLVDVSGNIRRIENVDTTSQKIFLDGGLSGSSFWFVPVDPATGKSPCIGVFKRSFEL